MRFISKRIVYFFFFFLILFRRFHGFLAIFIPADSVGVHIRKVYSSQHFPHVLHSICSRSKRVIRFECSFNSRVSITRFECFRFSKPFSTLRRFAIRSFVRSYFFLIFDNFCVVVCINSCCIPQCLQIISDKQFSVQCLLLLNLHVIQFPSVLRQRRFSPCAKPKSLRLVNKNVSMEMHAFQA